MNAKKAFINDVESLYLCFVKKFGIIKAGVIL